MIDVHENWECLLFQNYFSFIYKTTWDRYYVDDRIPGLKERFINVDYYLKKIFGK